MAARQRRSKRRGKLEPDAEAWRRGDRDCGFIKFKPRAELRAPWDQYGDQEKYGWTEGQSLPRIATSESSQPLP